MLSSSPHTHDASSIDGIMRQVLVALLPGYVVYLWMFGWGLLIHTIIAVIAACGCEAIVLRLRNKPVRTTLADGSVVLLAVLFALAVSPLAPWWITVIGVSIAALLGKHAYGGLGTNVFNPAMVGYAAVLVSFPAYMSVWPVHADAISGATPLTAVRTELALMHMISEFSDSPVFGVVGAARWEWVNLAFATGGVWLLAKRAIGWHIPVAVLTGLATISLFFYVADSDAYLAPQFHLFSGATMLCAFFIATDPVSAPSTPLAKLIFGLSIGVVIFLIRTFASYPDGIAFAVLTLNAAAPTLSRLTRPRILGEQTG